MNAVLDADAERRIRQRLKDDFAHYASRCLRIRTKAGAVEPFVLNRAQQFIHSRLEEQLERTGKVRAILLKGRQQGASTYIGGRFYWKVTHRKGVRAFILTHEEEATANLFGMTVRYHENCPPLVRPETKAASAKELSFAALDSGYKVGTAGNRGVGRSQTFQYLHGSEVAFWPHANEHAAGALQAVPNEPGTEVALESTANGVGGYFHETWQKAEAGESEYQAIFVPWYWQPEYSMPVPEGFVPSAEEADMQAAYGLTLEQMAWRREKLAQLGSEDLLLQEYPNCAADAFRSTGIDAFIDAATILRARKTRVEAATGPLLMGVDPARFGTDRSAIIRRRGRKAYGIQTYMRLDTMQLAGIVARIIDTENPDKVFVDVNGLGAGVYDRLIELGYGSKVIPVNAGEAPLDRDRYIIKRDEMWGGLRDWLKDAPCEIPDSDELHADLGTVGYSFDSKSRYKLESKVDMRKRGVRSPDLGDALALTFAYPVSIAAAKPFVRHRTGWRE